MCMDSCVSQRRSKQVGKSFVVLIQSEACSGFSQSRWVQNEVLLVWLRSVGSSIILDQNSFLPSPFPQFPRVVNENSYNRNLSTSLDTATYVITPGSTLQLSQWEFLQWLIPLKPDNDLTNITFTHVKYLSQISMNEFALLQQGSRDEIYL